MTHTCVICKQKIIVEKEKWVHLIDYDKKQQIGETFYHLECWRGRFKIDNSIRKQKMYKQVQNSMGNIGKMLQTLQKNIPQQKVYQTDEIPPN